MQTVIHLVSADEKEQETALAIARNLLEEESRSIDEVAVVAQGGGAKAVMADGNYGDQIRALQEDGVSFSVCRNTLDTMDANEADLVENVEAVPEGAVEVTRLQSEGYAYIRP